MTAQPAGEDRMFTQGEAYAIADDAVKRETAAKDEKITELEKAKGELETKVDTLETEKAAETQRADAAVKDLEDYKQAQEQAKTAAERLETRKKELAEANPFLDLTEERMARIAAKSDEDYAVYLGEMREVAEKAKAAGGTAPPPPPPGSEKETAAFKPGGDDKKPTGSVMAMFAARDEADKAKSA